MIRSLIIFSLRFPWIVIGLATAVLVAGGLRLQTASWDVFPEFAPPQIVVQTEAPGLSTEEVEQLVALPVESVLSGVSRLKLLRSSSVPGLCVDTAIFEDGTDVLVARQLVNERLSTVRSLLPNTVDNPRLMPLAASTSRLVMVGLTSDGKATSQDLRTLADWTLRRRLQAVPGVAHVEVFGGEIRQYQIQVSPQKLQKYGVTLDEVVAAGQQATGFGGAGFIETPNQRLPIRQRTRIESPDDLAIALGEVVDDAIVDVENVLRRLRENQLATEPRPVLDVILDASLEVRSAVVYASFIVILVFLPVFFLDGLAGKLFGPLGLAYVVAILVSLAIALTITPAMCLLMLGSRSSLSQSESWLTRICNAFYRRTLPFFLRRPVAVFIFVGLLLALAGSTVPFLGGEFLPDFRESNFVVFMAGKPDSSLAESERSGTKLAKELLQIPGVKSVAQQIGRADLSEDTWGPNISEVWISLSDDAAYDDVLREIREVLDNTPGYAFQAKQFLRERIDEVLTGSTADLLVRIVGPDLDVLRRESAVVASVLSRVEGVADLRVEQLMNVPQIDILLQPHVTAGFGLSAGKTNDAIQTLLRGTQVGQVFESDTVVDVVVRGAPELRNDPQTLREILIDSPLGHPVPLGALAEIGISTAPNAINREQGRRRMLVTCNAEERDVETVLAEIRDRLQSEVRLPSGYYFEFAGEFEAKAEAQRRMFWLSLASLLGILVLLFLDFRSLRLSLLIMLSVPLACVGGIVSAYLAGGTLSLGSMVGFVTVFGIAIRNGILLISNYQHLAQRGTRFSRELILTGSVERISPILMTAGTTVLAITPLVISGNLPGHEIEHPMAVVITGGIVSSTLLTLFVLPAIVLIFAGSRSDD